MTYLPPPPPPPAPAPKQPWRPSIAIVVVVAIVLALVVAGAVGAGRTSSGSSATATTAASGPSMKSKVRDWATEHGDLVTNLTAALGSLGNASTGGDFQTACTDIQTASAAAAAAPSIPDPAADAPWQAALSDYAAASQLCLDGIDQGDNALISEATTRIQSGTTHVKEATDALSKWSN